MGTFNKNRVSKWVDSIIELAASITSDQVTVKSAIQEIRVVAIRLEAALSVPEITSLEAFFTGSGELTQASGDIRHMPLRRALYCYARCIKDEASNLPAAYSEDAEMYKLQALGGSNE